MRKHQTIFSRWVPLLFQEGVVEMNLFPCLEAAQAKFRYIKFRRIIKSEVMRTREKLSP